jgi:hypothetical protein
MLFYSINDISRLKLRKVDTIWIKHLTNEYTSTHLHKHNGAKDAAQIRHPMEDFHDGIVSSQ